MARVTFSANEVPTVSKMNSLADQCVIQSNSAPSSPLEGMLWYDTNAAHPLVYAYNGSDWFPLPMGLMAKSSIVDTGPGIDDSPAVVVNGSTLSFAPESGQRYRYSVDFHFSSSEIDDLWEVQLQYSDDGSSTWNNAEESFIFQTPAADKNVRVSVQTIDTPTTATYAYRTQVYRYYGTGIGTVYGGTDVTVEHIGDGTLPTSTGL